MEKLEHLIRSALSKVDRTDPAARLRVYEATKVAVSKLPAQSSALLQPKLAEVISRIEAEHAIAPGSVDRVAQDVSQPGTDLPEKSAPVGHKKGSAEEAVSIKSADPAAPRASLIRKMVGGAFVLAIVGAIYATLQYRVSGGKSYGVFDYLIPAGEEAISLSFVLPNDISQLGPSAFGDLNGERYFADNVIDGEFRVFDRNLIHFGDFFQVDPKKTYRMRVEIELPAGLKSMPSFRSGFALFDAEKKFLTDTPGARRFFVSAGWLQGTPPVGEPRQVVLEGEITGIEASEPTAFGEGVAFARIIVSANFKDEGQFIILKSVELNEVN